MKAMKINDGKHRLLDAMDTITVAKMAKKLSTAELVERFNAYRKMRMPAACRISAIMARELQARGLGDDKLQEILDALDALIELDNKR